MNKTVALIFFVTACASANRQWQADQNAQAQQEAANQPANMEQLCKGAVDAYCTRCGIGQPQCGQTYSSCIGTVSPADASGFTAGGVDQCVAAVQAGDCNVMPNVWPAACSAQSQPAASVADTNAVPACDGGATWDGAQCMCPEGTGWDGAQCAPVQQEQPVQEEQSAQQERDTGRRCRVALTKRGFQPVELSNCDGVNDRCAVAVIKRGFQPIEVTNCRGVEGKCAEALMQSGRQPVELANCKR